MKTVVAIFFLAVAAVVVLLLLAAAVRAIARRYGERRDEHAPWELAEHSDGEQVCVYAERPGDERLLIGAAPFGSTDFDSQLYEVRAQGREKVYALNNNERTK